MGLLDNPDSLQQLGMAFGLLNARKGDNWPALLTQYAQQKNAQQNQERLNRANDLQQLQGAYSMLKQQEFAKMLAAKQNGQPYSPNPMLPQMEAKLADLTGLGNLSGKLGLQTAGQRSPMPQAPATAQAPMPQPQGQMSQVQRPQMPQAGMQMPQQDSSGLGGPAGGIPMEAWLAQDLTGKAYLEQLAKDHAPQNVRPGGSLAVMGPDGKYNSAFYAPQLAPGVMPQRDRSGNVSGASEIPGFAGAASNIKGAETSAVEAAKAPYDIKMVQQADGSMRPMSVASLAGQAPQQPGQRPGVASLTVTEPSRQSQVPQPKSEPNDPFGDMPKIPQTPGIGQSSYDANMSKLRSDHAAKLFDTYGTAADEAQKRVALNNQALSVIDRADTGTGAALIGDVKKALTTRFGIPEEDFSNDPTATAVLQKDLLNAATQRAKQQFGARMTQSEVMMMLKRGAPNVDMTKASIKFLLDTDNAAANYAVQQANHYGEYISRGGDPLRFQGYYANKFPLTKAEDSLTLGTGNDTVIRYDRTGKRVQ